MINLEALRKRPGGASDITEDRLASPPRYKLSGASERICLAHESACHTHLHPLGLVQTGDSEEQV